MWFVLRAGSGTENYLTGPFADQEAAAKYMHETYHQIEDCQWCVGLYTEKPQPQSQLPGMLDDQDEFGRQEDDHYVLDEGDRLYMTIESTKPHNIESIAAQL